MDIHKILVTIRRAKLRLIRGNKQLTSDNNMPKKAKRIVFSDSYIGKRILCQPKPKTSNNSNKLPKLPPHALCELLYTGPAVAPTLPTAPMARTTTREASKDDTVEIISNAGVLTIPDEKDVPNEYEFEILRLRRRVDELECTVRDRDERNVRAIAMLEDEMQFWRSLMYDHIEAKYGDIQRRIMRIESTLMTLREKGSRYYPPLPLPAGWTKQTEER